MIIPKKIISKCPKTAVITAPKMPRCSNILGRREYRGCSERGASSKWLRMYSFDFSYSTVKANDVIELDSMREEIVEDLRASFVNYIKIKRSFIDHIDRGHYNAHNQCLLIQTLSLLSQYPSFPLPNPTMLLIYKIVCLNMQWKSVEEMNQLLLFVLVADQQPSQSPIFHQFIRFYLHLALEEYKFKYQIDFSSLSVLQALKQLLSRLLQRGFLPRSPPYQRNLNIVDQQRTLYLLSKCPQVRSSLMVKKLNYSLFLGIKQFYEGEMGENLYHSKKAELFSLFRREYVQVLSQSIEMTHHQAIHLRELYIKLYLTLPQQPTPLSPHKYKSVVYLYWFSMQHLASIDHLALDHVQEGIEVVIDFVKAVAQNMANLLTHTQQYLLSLSLEVDEVLLIILLLIKQGQNAENCISLLTLVVGRINAFTMWYHFQLLLKVLRHYSQTTHLASVFKDSACYQLLSLEQLCSLLEVVQVKTENYSVTVSRVMSKVMRTDFQVIGGSEVICLLRVYQACLSVPEKEGELVLDSQRLRIFLMRYISDHHQEFSIKQLQRIVLLLSALPASTLLQFNDDSQNYPLPLPQQIGPYLGKVTLLMSAQARQVCLHWAEKAVAD